MGTLIYVRNLTKDVTSAQLFELFAQAGEVADVYLVTDRWTATPKGFAFVQMESESDAKRAVKLLNGSTWFNRTLLVRFTTETDENLGGIMFRQKAGATNND